MDDEQPNRRKRKRLLLATAGLTAGTLLTAFGGCEEGAVIANPKGPWYDGGGYDGGDGGADGPDAEPIPLDGNPKGAWYDDGGYAGGGAKAA